MMVGRIFGAIAAVLILALFGSAASLANGPMFVKQGGAKILKLTAPATDVIVADPSVVDVSVQTQNELVLIGKSYGVTQLIILSGDTVLLDSEVVVATANQNSSVSVFSAGKGGITERSYSCYKRCATSELVSAGEGSAGQAITVTVGGEGTGGAGAAVPGSGGSLPTAPAAAQ